MFPNNAEDINTKDCSILHLTTRITTQTASGPAARCSSRASANYVTTKKKWHVAFINDRRLAWNGADSGDFAAAKIEYRVCWLNRKRNQRSYYKKAWEPLMLLFQDGFDRELNLVDRWVRSFETNFNKFCSTDPYGKHLFGANTSGLCIFEAFMEAAKLAGLSNICTRDDIAAVVEEERRGYGFGLTDV
ncbi:unnamed protein product [Phytophthora fragariaefolia]|uniref:Unnamed protein product n=1 Tax=Phytophthora fragariaefolia TaxID=1490495 RepID=A0A9W6UE12_9STRA|nr:unnamed protein product [Phytophthora fragariaefolia]